MVHCLHLPNMVSDSWLWRISREIEANQKRNLNPDRRRIFRGWDYKKLLNIHATFETQKDRNNETVLIFWLSGRCRSPVSLQLWQVAIGQSATVEPASQQDGHSNTVKCLMRFSLFYWRFHFPWRGIMDRERINSFHCIFVKIMSFKVKLRW